MTELQDEDAVRAPTKAGKTDLVEVPEPGTTLSDACFTLSAIGAHFLAGLLEHARATSVFYTPTVNGFGRFRPNALAPQSVLWGRDNRGAMLRVIGQAGDAATRIENRIGEPAANPYLYLASQIHAGLYGIERKLEAPAATSASYGGGNSLLPTSLGEALGALRGDAVLAASFGQPFIDHFAQIKEAELLGGADVYLDWFMPQVQDSLGIRWG